MKPAVSEAKKVRVRELRKKGMTYIQIAKATGLSESTIGRIVKNRPHTPTRVVSKPAAMQGGDSGPEESIEVKVARLDESVRHARQLLTLALQELSTIG